MATVLLLLQLVYLLRRVDADFYGDRCQWTGLCHLPFVTVKRFLRAVRKLNSDWGISTGDVMYSFSSAGLDASELGGADAICTSDEQGSRCRPRT